MAGDILVGSIDFGTTYLGWAILFAHQFESDPTKSYVKQWYSSTSTLITEKAPTVVLIKPDGQTLEAVGYDAENRYKELVEKEEHENYFYFRRFKMKLHKQFGEKTDLDMTLEDEMGRRLPAINVFSMAIKFLVEDMHKEVKDTILGGIEMSEVRLVITVPAIWSDSAKQFMRIAGEKAGIAGDKLNIALEPEAASIFCRHLPVEKRRDITGVSIASFPVGTKYLVLDAGGGTIDITVHEVQSSGTVKEIKAASGGGWGGTLVDEAFEKLLTDIIGRHVYDRFKKEQTEDWIDLWRDFEVKKRNVLPDKDTKIAMKIPVSLCQVFEQTRQQSLSKAVESSAYSESIKFEGEKMKIQANIFKKFFETSLTKTIQHIEDLLRDPAVRQIRAILMVGGFSESPMLQQKVKSSFPEIDVIIPAEASSSIMRGAVIFGHSPKSISERVLRYTYGVNSLTPFIEGKHPESKKIREDSGLVCKDVFDKHVEKNQIVKVGEPQVTRSYTPARRDQTGMDVQIYASELKDPKYTDAGCRYVGNMHVKLPDHDGDLNRAVKLSLTFSGTEIEVTAVDEKTGQKTKASINFLG